MGRAQGLKDSFTGVFGDKRGSERTDIETAAKEKIFTLVGEWMRAGVPIEPDSGIIFLFPRDLTHSEISVISDELTRSYSLRDPLRELARPSDREFFIARPDQVKALNLQTVAYGIGAVIGVAGVKALIPSGRDGIRLMMAREAEDYPA